MTKSSRKRWLIAALAAALFVIVAYGLLQVDHVKGEDRNIRIWSLQAYNNIAVGRAMIIEAGTNAVPALARLSQTRDSFLRKQFWSGAQKLPPSNRRSIAQRIAPPSADAVRAAACRSLGLLGPKSIEATPALIVALSDDDSRVRAEAEAALLQVGKESVPAIVQSLNHRNPAVRRGAASVLAQMGTNAAVAVPDLRRNLGDADPRARYLAAYALACMGVSGVGALIDAIREKQSPAQDIASAMLTNKFITLQIAASAFFTQTHDKSPDVRRQAIEALGYFRGDSLALIAAMEALKDQVTDVRLTAVAGLARNGDASRDAVDTFTMYLKDENPAVRELAASSLGNLGAAAQTAVTELTRLAESGGAAEQTAARIAIGKIRR